jgi:hypothetical protein
VEGDDIADTYNPAEENMVFGIEFDFGGVAFIGKCIPHGFIIAIWYHFLTACQNPPQSYQSHQS